MQSSEFTLDNVAALSGTSVQTVLRAFGNKEALILAAIGTSRADPPTDAQLPSSIGEAVGQLFDDYEEIGDRVIRMLGEEHRIPGFAAAAAEGRERHRDWVRVAFGEHLAEHPRRGGARS